jgi:hypothetical protein
MTPRGEDQMTTRPHIQTFEQRVAAALTDDAITSAGLADLLDELEAAINQGTADIEAQRQTSLDPLLSPNATAARETVANTTFMNERLRSLLPRLERRYSEVRAAEESAVWNAEADRTEATVRELAAELKNTFPEAVAKLTDLLTRCAAADRAVAATNLAAPPTEHRRLRGPELVARELAGFSSGQPSLAKQLQLPNWQGSVLLWPPPQTPISVLLTAGMSAPAHRGGDWWKDIEIRNVERQQETQRVHAFYAEQEQRRAERDEAERRERLEADEREREVRYGRR